MNHENPTRTETPSIEMRDLDALWFQITGTRCNLTCSHCFISCSPHNDQFGFLPLSTVQHWLQESRKWGVREYYYTGGEPFLHPDMTRILKETLEIGPATVLTNGTVLKESWLQDLQRASQGTYSLEFRVSLDGFSPETNDPIRGARSFERTMTGIMKLVAFGFLPIITAARVWDDEEESNVIDAFVEMLRQRGYQRPRLKLLPKLKLGAEVQRTHGYREDELVTAAMMKDADPSSFLCSHSRIVTDRGIHVCPLLIDEPDSLMGQTMEEAAKPFELKHGACWTCYQHGAICSNAPSYKIQPPISSQSQV